MVTIDDGNGYFVSHLSPAPSRWTLYPTLLRSALGNGIAAAAAAVGESRIMGL